MFGAISHISASYFSFHMRFQPVEQGKPFSSAGIILYNDKEGKYLNRSRFYVSYAWHASLSRKLQFSAGLSVGGMNYSVEGTPLSGDGSDTKVDGAVGISFYSDAFHVGLSFGQIFNSKVQPLEEITVLSPFINMYANRKFLFNENFLFSPSFTARIPFINESGDKLNPLFDMNLLIELRKKLLISSGIHNNSMMIIAAGIKGLSISHGELGIMVSYAFPGLRKTLIRTNYGEIGIHYSF